jgi:DedD protein
LNSGFKQRLVGAFVLVALALILWPVVMGPKRDQSFVIESDIPAKPVFGPSEIRPAEPRADVSPIGEYQQKLSAQSEQAQQQGRARPALDADGVPVGWVIQVASFSQSDNATRLKQQLQTSGYRAQIKMQKGDGGNYARVFVGPYIDQTIAQRDLDEIARQLKIKPKLVRFSP